MSYLQKIPGMIVERLKETPGEPIHYVMDVTIFHIVVMVTLILSIAFLFNFFLC